MDIRCDDRDLLVDIDNGFALLIKGIITFRIFRTEKFLFGTDRHISPLTVGGLLYFRFMSEILFLLNPTCLDLSLLQRSVGPDSGLFAQAGFGSVYNR